MSKKKSAILCLALMLLMNTAEASEITDSEYADGVYSVDGISDIANMPVKIEVLNNGYVFEDLNEVSAENLGTYYYYANVADADANGNFTFEIPAPAGAFNHVVRISFFGSDTVLSDSFATYTEDDMNKAIDSFLGNSAKNASDLEDLVNSYYGKLGIDYDSFKKFDSEVICKNVIDSLGEESTKDDLMLVLSANIAVKKLDSKETATEAVETLETEFAKLGIEGTEYEKSWVLLDNDTKTEITNTVWGKSLSADKVSKAVKNGILFTELKNALWNEQEGILQKYFEDTKIYESKISDIDDSEWRKEVYTEFKSMVNSGQITEMSDVLSELDALTDKHKTEEDDDSSNNRRASKGGSVSFKPTAPVVQKPIEVTIPFDDIEDVNWASKSIISLNAKGIVTGKDKRLFCPNDSITREEYAAILVRAFGLNTQGSDCIFQDVPKDSWSYAYVATAKEAGIVNGISETEFGAKDNISRQDMAVMAYRAAMLKGITFAEGETVTFLDADSISQYALEAVNAMASKGIINGTGEGFEPIKNSTRAEAAKVIYGLMQYCGIIE